MGGVNQRRALARKQKGNEDERGEAEGLVKVVQFIPKDDMDISDEEGTELMSIRRFSQDEVEKSTENQV